MILAWAGQPSLHILLSSFLLANELCSGFLLVNNWEPAGDPGLGRTTLTPHSLIFLPIGWWFVFLFPIGR